MKYALTIIAIIFILIADSFPQELQDATLVMEIVPDAQNVKQRTFSINCQFADTVSSDSVTKIKNWRVFSGQKQIVINDILFRPIRPTQVKLTGDFDPDVSYSVQYGNGSRVLVSTDKVTSARTSIAFGEGKAIDMRFRRLAQQASNLAFDYQADVNVVEKYLALPAGSFWLHSLSLNLASEGTFGGTLSHLGTETEMGLRLQPYFFVGGLIYQAELKTSYKLETHPPVDSGELLKIINKAFAAGVEIEVPYSNLPIYKLHSHTGYARLAMPLTLNLEYLFAGEDQSGHSTNARLDFRADYELAFSPYLILQGSWGYSRFLDTPPEMKDTADFYSVTFAQDLDVLKNKLDFLEPLLGKAEKARGKHFIFYRMTVGRKPPAFLDKREQSFGFGLFL